MSGHTPGPWKLIPRSDGKAAFIMNESGEIIIADSVRIEYDYEKANAHLIAAAPEMLAELQRLYNIDTDQQVLSQTDRIMLYQVIAKAKGESHEAQ